MAYLLDTNVIIAYLKGQSASLISRVDSTPIHEIFLCSTVKSELTYGAICGDQTEETLAKQKDLCDRYNSLSFNDEAAIVAGQEQARLAELGTPLEFYDLLIAGIALANGLTLVTHNVPEFERIDRLNIEDWESS